MRWEPNLWNYALFGLVFLILTNASVALYNAYKPFPKTFEEALVDSRYSHIDFTSYIKSGNSLVLYRIKDGFQITDAVLQPPLGKINITSDEYFPLGDPIKVSSEQTIAPGQYFAFGRNTFHVDTKSIAIDKSIISKVTIEDQDRFYSKDFLEALGKAIANNINFKIGERAHYPLHPSDNSVMGPNRSNEDQNYQSVKQFYYRKIKCQVMSYDSKKATGVKSVEVICLLDKEPSSSQMYSLSWVHSYPTRLKPEERPPIILPKY